MCLTRVNPAVAGVRYYGYYSNVSRGKRQKENQDGLMPYILEPVESLQVNRPAGSSKEYRKNWARFIQKIYELDPLTCPKCQGRMCIIAFIEDPEVIKKILKHLDLWNLKTRSSPRANAPPNNIEPQPGLFPPGRRPLWAGGGIPATSTCPLTCPQCCATRGGRVALAQARHAGPTITSM